MLLSFSVRQTVNQHCGMGQQTVVEALTNVEHIAPSACIEAQGSIACWTRLRVECFNIFVEALFVGDMAAGELQNAFAE
jgi:hypothetical protein